MPTVRRTLVHVNPTNDLHFAADVRAELDRGPREPGGLADALRDRYPHVRVQERLLEHGPVMWYVYREGRWASARADEGRERRTAGRDGRRDRRAARR